MTAADEQIGYGVVVTDAFLSYGANNVLNGLKMNVPPRVM